MPIASSSRALQVLIVEDHPPDVRLLLEGLHEDEVPHQFIVCENSVDAGQYLAGMGKYAHYTRPDLVILDVSLPIWSGLDLLERMKEDPVLKAIPVIVFSSSQARCDVEKAYDLKASCYLSKPIRWEEYKKVVEWIRSFWMHTVALPPQSDRDWKDSRVSPVC
jgi:chemotaxis family two-component system response regulator Rcp1